MVADIETRRDMPLSADILQAILHTSSQEEHWNNDNNNKLATKLSNLERNPSHPAQCHILHTGSTTPQREEQLVTADNTSPVILRQEPSPGLVV